MVASAKQKATRRGVKQKEKFAEGFCFKKMFFVFLIGSIIGSIYEELLHAAETFWETGQAEWSLRRGVIYGPFNVIYGLGAVLMICLLAKESYEWWKVFLYAAILGGVVEFMISFLQEVFTHTRSWDYSNEFLDIDGRTTVPFMLVWGLLGLILVKVVYPWISNLIEKIPVEVGNFIFMTLLVFMILDMLISWSALIRQTMRHNHIPSYTPIGEFYDKYYSDAYLQKYFPNMQHLDEK